MELLDYRKDIALKEAEIAELFAAHGAALHAEGHDDLAHLFRTEATHCRHYCIQFGGSPNMTTRQLVLRDVRHCFEEMLHALQAELVPLLNRAQAEAALAEAERQLDWLEAQLYSIQELGEAHYLSQLEI